MAKVVRRSLMGKKTKNKPLQYAIAGVVSVIVIALWITSPGRSSSFNAAVIAAGNPFSSRVSDISALSSSEEKYKSSLEQMAAEMGSHDGGNNLLGTLFRSGTGAEEEIEDAGTAFASSVESNESSYGSSASEVSSPNAVSEATRAKMSAIGSSFSSGGKGSSSSSGDGKHSKFFGSGSVKANIARVDVSTPKNIRTGAVQGQGLTSLKTASLRGAQAVKTANLGQASVGNSLSFDGGTTKANTDFLDTGVEAASGLAQLGMSQAISDLKSGNPIKNVNKVTPKVNKAKEDKDKSADDEMKKMLLQFLLNNLVGPAFSSVLGGLSSTSK